MKPLEANLSVADSTKAWDAKPVESKAEERPGKERDSHEGNMKESESEERGSLLRESKGGVMFYGRSLEIDYFGL